MSDLIPPLDPKKQSGRPVRNDTQTKGKSYSITLDHKPTLYESGTAAGRQGTIRGHSLPD